MRAPLAIVLASAWLLNGCTLVRPLDGLTCEGDTKSPECKPACAPGAGARACRFGQPCARSADCATGMCGGGGACECLEDMVAVQSSFCIDRAEVTIGAYGELVASGAKPDKATPGCAWNTTFAIDVGMPESPMECVERTAAMPVTCIDWCDAAAYCRFRGKRLCGRMHGGAVPLSQLADPKVNEWFDACSAGGKRSFATEEAPADCNGDSLAPVAAAAPGMEVCEGGFDGLQHMSGNVREWEDSCSGGSSPEDDCRVRGGSFDLGASVDDGYAEIRCDTDDTVKRSDTTFDIGFRCCAG